MITMSATENEVTARRILEEVWQQHNFEVIDELLAGEYVVVHWRLTDIHVGEMGTIEPTNEEVTITGFEIGRYEDGMLAETWQVVDMLPMLMRSGSSLLTSSPRSCPPTPEAPTSPTDIPGRLR